MKFIKVSSIVVIAVCMVVNTYYTISTNSNLKIMDKEFKNILLEDGVELKPNTYTLQQRYYETDKDGNTIYHSYEKDEDGNVIYNSKKEIKYWKNIW